eukprot:GEMP01092217.1.p1 GENE.GEMP01092217.1~~GEMP01092217.1.p1  ORF type:complete len:146 (+),score=21.65 GEMP01092217.1:213-650(+)
MLFNCCYQRAARNAVEGPELLDDLGFTEPAQRDSEYYPQILSARQTPKRFPERRTPRTLGDKRILRRVEEPSDTTLPNLASWIPQTIDRNALCCKHEFVVRECHECSEADAQEDENIEEEELLVSRFKLFQENATSREVSLGFSW